MAGLPGHASGQDDDNSGWAGPPVGGTHLGPDLRVNPGIGDIIDPVCVKRTAVSGVGNNCLVNSIRHALLNTIPASVSFLSCGGWLCVRVSVRSTAARLCALAERRWGRRSADGASEQRMEHPGSGLRTHAHACGSRAASAVRLAQIWVRARVQNRARRWARIRRHVRWP